ncbi:hypothetical protein PBCVCan184_926L [Paramecium bursaria Chlorella virus Can18-4]|nr:hypothetical protein PBCVCan184_926L [Paramecium bursaria Chlorella virus Can18-4]
MTIGDFDTKKVLAGRQKCDCFWDGRGMYPKQYMKIGLPGGKRYFCEKCPGIPSNAVYIDNSYCHIKNCKKRAFWTSDGTRNNRVCSFHRDPKKTYEDVISPKCPCGKRPNFGYPGELLPISCNKCKKDGMIDVKNKKCSCGKSPKFNYLGETRGIACAECKTNDMIDVVNKKCPCGKRMLYNYPEEKYGIACATCKKNGMIDVINPTCPGYNGVKCPVRTQLTNGHKYCIVCDPDDTRRITRKIDEEAFFSFLDNNGISITQREYRIDYKCIDTNKSHSFIDGIIISKDIVVCLEVDEEAHQHYDPTCEEARLNNASAELRLQYPNHYISWVRINPNILTKNGKRDRSLKAKSIRDCRHKKALYIIKNVLENPNDSINYIGYN